MEHEASRKGNCSLHLYCYRVIEVAIAAYNRKMSGRYKLIEMGGPGDYLHYRFCCVLTKK